MTKDEADALRADRRKAEHPEFDWVVSCAPQSRVVVGRLGEHTPVGYSRFKVTFTLPVIERTPKSASPATSGTPSTGGTGRHEPPPRWE